MEGVDRREVSDGSSQLVSVSNLITKNDGNSGPLDF
jgi:hypothetical protein